MNFEADYSPSFVFSRIKNCYNVDFLDVFMPYSLVLFDLDGTLIDSSIGIYHSYLAALSLFNETVELETLRRKIGPPAPETFKELFPELFSNAQNLRKVLSGQRKYYRSQGFLESTLYPDIKTVLKALKRQGKTLCIATSKPTVFAKKILEHQKLAVYFDVVIGSTLSLSRTKKTDIIAAMLKKYPTVPLSEIIMIGDKRHDIEGARANGIDSIGVTYGFGSPAEIKAAKPTYTAHTTTELLEIL